METSLDILEKVPLSVPLMVNALNMGKKQVEIARMCGITYQAVSEYKIRHFNEISSMLDNSDTLLALNSKQLVIKAQRNLDTILDYEPEKKDMIALNAISGTHTEKYLLLSGKATEITVNATMITDVNELLNQLKSVK